MTEICHFEYLISAAFPTPSIKILSRGRTLRSADRESLSIVRFFTIRRALDMTICSVHLGGATCL